MVEKEWFMSLNSAKLRVILMGKLVGMHNRVSYGQSVRSSLFQMWKKATNFSGSAEEIKELEIIFEA
ncbi:Hypothetical predicted protein [Podarcis lilfordi]|uniref:Uncharacterized protein n=1 Tax=Podarcis lilfordi TaxID=74358 RepID=A0AA35JY11_9SAUR|nr:Hypothetical predicted protein [Podarcis lilfordi]